LIIIPQTGKKPLHFDFNFFRAADHFLNLNRKKRFNYPILLTRFREVIFSRILREQWNEKQNPANKYLLHNGHRLI
jgi:hypothetical protein